MHELTTGRAVPSGTTGVAGRNFGSFFRFWLGARLQYRQMAWAPLGHLMRAFPAAAIFSIVFGRLASCLPSAPRMRSLRFLRARFHGAWTGSLTLPASSYSWR
jgi:hypothetical protein